MKIKTIITGLFLLLSLCNTTANAQITLTQSNMFSIGDNFIRATDYTPTIGPGSSGINQTWNFSSLGISFIDTIFGVDPVASPFYNEFPTATVADSNYSRILYFNSTPSSFLEPGEVAFPNISFYYTPFYEFLKLPLHYLDNWNQNFVLLYKDSANSDPGYDSIMYKEYTNEFDSIDAWGTMMTTYGTDSVLREKEVYSIVDSIFLQPNFSNTWTYINLEQGKFQSFFWWSNAIRHWDVIMAVDTNGNPQNVEWIYSTLPSSVNTISNANRTIIYPNPANVNLTIQTSVRQNAFTLIYDLAGNLIKVIPLINGQAQLEVGNLTSGMYFYEIKDNSNVVLDRGKFSVVK